jgi:hypothetical protein
MNMATVSKYSTPIAAGDEVHRRAAGHVSAHGGAYQNAVHAVLAADPGLAQAYAQSAARVSTMATKPADTRSQPAVPVTTGEEPEIQEWLLRALKDGKAGSLPGALGALALEADQFAKIGMPIEAAARRAMDSHPHLVIMAKLLLADARRNAPDNTPVPSDKATGLAQGMPAGDIVHNRVQALVAEHPSLDYHEAMGAVFAPDPALKAAYARS